MIRRLILVPAVLSLLSAAAVAAPCPGKPETLGTERILEVSAATTPRIGRKHFPNTLPLGAKELVLTFDDGPWPGTTPKILEALAAECVRASFFMLGQHAEAAPQLARRVLAEGHTVAHHTYSHPILDKLSTDAAEAEINRGFNADDFAVFGQRRNEPATPFFRFPGFDSGFAGANAATKYCRVRRGFMGERLGDDDAGAPVRTDHGAHRTDRAGNRSFSRHARADRGDAAALSA
jgi:hypothetical protein